MKVTKNTGKENVRSLEVFVTEDSFVEDSNYTAEQLLEFFKKGDDSFDWSYNIVQDVFGYGDDARDWENNGDDYIDSSQILSIAKNHKYQDVTQDVVYDNDKYTITFNEL